VTGALLVSGANAAAPTVLLTLSVAGSGSVKVTNEAPVRCTGTCHMTFRIKAGSKIVVLPKANALWKLAPFTGACKGVLAKCTLHMTKAQQLSVKFVAPGAQANPIPLGSTWFVSGNWLFQVNGVTPNANGQVQNPDGTPQQAPTGTQFFVLGVAVTYKGSGSANFGDFARELTAVGGHGTKYAYTSGNGCGPGKSVLPSHDIQPKAVAASPVESNQTVSGNICFQVAAGDAASLALVVGGQSKSVQQVWFGLR
jgi:hypothetical protein